MRDSSPVSTHGSTVEIARPSACGPGCTPSLSTSRRAATRRHSCPATLWSLRARAWSTERAGCCSGRTSIQITAGHGRAGSRRWRGCRTQAAGRRTGRCGGCSAGARAPSSSLSTTWSATGSTVLPVHMNDGSYGAAFPLSSPSAFACACAGASPGRARAAGTRRSLRS